MRHEEILHRCFRCGFCKLTADYSAFNCPSYLKFGFDTYAPAGRMWLLRAWLMGDLPMSPHLQEIIFSCATCGSCVEHCAFPFRDDLVNIFIAAREEMVLRGQIPPAVRDYLKAMQVYGNPYKLPQADRGAWAAGTGLEAWQNQEHLLYVGCVAAYDDIGQRMARAVGTVLVRLGVSLGILGARETCDGNEVRAVGETGLFALLAEANIRLWHELGVRRIITVDPHAYHALARDYPALGGDFEVFHYSQVLAASLEAAPERLQSLPLKVAFHDPCYLGRHSGDYASARRCLTALPGLELLEMPQIRADALCCGGGGGNFFTDILGAGPQAPARVRVRQALATGAQILAVACPQCARMLADAVKSEEADEQLRVRDVAEIVLEALA